MKINKCAPRHSALSSEHVYPSLCCVAHFVFLFCIEERERKGKQSLLIVASDSRADAGNTHFVVVFRVGPL